MRSSRASRRLSTSSSSSNSSSNGGNYLPTYNDEHRRQKQSKHHYRNHSYSHNKSIQYTDDLDTDSNSLRINVMKDLKSAQKLKSNLKNSSNLSYSATLPFNYKNSLNNNNNEIKLSTNSIMQAENLSTSFKGTKPKKKFCLQNLLFLFLLGLHDYNFKID